MSRLSSNAPADSRMAQADAASPREQHRRIPSFKLMEDEHARSKRLRNRVPCSGRATAEGAVEGSPSPSPFMPMFEDTVVPPVNDAVGVSSFTLSSSSYDVLNTNMNNINNNNDNNSSDMTLTSSWSPVVGGNCLDFGPASFDVDGEYIQRLDDTSFADLNFLAMDDMMVSPVALLTVGSQQQQQQQKEESGAKGLEIDAANETGAGSIDRFGGSDGDHHRGNNSNNSSSRDPQATSNAGDEGMVAVKSEEGRRFSGRDMLMQVGSGADIEHNVGCDILGASVFDPDGRLPTFSAPMEEYLNRQLEAAEQYLHGRNCDERSFGSVIGSAADGGGGGGGGGGGSGGGVAVGVGVGVGVDVHMTLAKESQRDTSTTTSTAPPPLRLAEGAGAFEPNADVGNSISNSSNSYTVGMQQQQQQQQQQYESEEEADSSHSEYEPPAPPPEEKLKKWRRGGRGAAAAAAASRASKLSSAAAGPRGSGGGLPGGGPAVSVPPRGTAKRQTSEDVAARLPLEVLECFYHVPLNVAAQQLNVSLTMLKKLCRAYGVKRWPHRQVSSLDKTISRLEEKIKVRRASGKEAPSLVRKLTQSRKRRGVIIKTASAGLEADVLNSIFTCRPGDIDEDLLLKSTDVAKAVEMIRPSLRAGHKESGSEEEDEDYEEDSHHCDNSHARALLNKTLSAAASLKKTATLRAVGGGGRLLLLRRRRRALTESSLHPPAFEPVGRAKSVSKFSDPSCAAVGALKAGLKASSVKLESLTPARRIKKINPAGVAAAAARARKGVAAAEAAVAAVAASASSASPVRGDAVPRAFYANASTGADSSSSAVVPPPAAPCGAAYQPGGLAGGDGGGGGAPLSGCSATLHSFGSNSPPRSTVPTAGYPRVFDMGVVHPSPAAGGGVSGPTSSSRAAKGIIIGRAASAGATAAKVETMQVSGGWIGAAAEKRALTFGEWRGNVSSSSSTKTGPSQQQQQQQRLSSNSTPPPPPADSSSTITATVDSFNAQLHLESPPGAQLMSSPPLPPLPSHASHGHHTYLQHQQFPPLPSSHQQQQRAPSFHRLSWVQGQAGYPGPPPPQQQKQQQQQQQQQQPFGLPADASLSPPVDLRFAPPGQTAESGDVNALAAVVADIGGGGDSAVMGDATTGGGNVCSGSGGEGGGGAVAAAAAAAAAASAAASSAAAAAAAAATASATAPAGGAPGGPRRTGFMSFLLQQ
ncbi:unnamed protein product, partial [Laminaria digitata]